MEVFVSNVPEQATAKTLRRFFDKLFKNLSIYTFGCDKPTKKPFAILTVLSFEDGMRFLAQFGQIKPGWKTRTLPPAKLTLNGQAIYCQQGNKKADEFKIRCLEKQESDRLSKQAKTHDAHPPEAPVANASFSIASVACGTLRYIGPRLVFNCEVQWMVQGLAKFSERALRVILSEEQKMDIAYTAIELIVKDTGSNPSLTFTLREAPRFYKNNYPNQQRTVEELLRHLGLQGRSRPLHDRVTNLGDGHAPVAGSCLVYRLQLTDLSSADLEGRLHALEGCRSMPSFVHHGTKSCHPIETWKISFTRLVDKLASITTGNPFAVAFQLQKLAQNGYLQPDKVLSLLPEVAAMTRRSLPAACVGAIRKLFLQINYPAPHVDASEFELDSLLHQLRDNEEAAKKEFLFGESIPGIESGNIAVIHRVNVTPAGMMLSGPEPESNNRVLRKYSGLHEYFLRVQFCDENGQAFFHSRMVSSEVIFDERFKSVLRNGISIAGRTFEFLGFSSSSLRAHCCWFVAPFTFNDQLHWNESIIRDLGDFKSIRSPAKCAARIGQVFSDTPDAVTVAVGVQKEIEDVERNGRCFSDGVGTISEDLMYKIWDKLRKKSLVKPSCFQIRYSGIVRTSSLSVTYLAYTVSLGAKGMISVDERLHGEVLNLRSSMIKFQGSPSLDVEICGGAYTPLPMRLNRQLIKIMEDLGVKEAFFFRLQDEEVKRLRMVMDSAEDASRFLVQQAIGSTIFLPWLIKELAMYNLNFRADSFLTTALELAMLLELRKMKHKGQIPVKKGLHLHGVMDETGFLEEGQVYCPFLVNSVSHCLIKDDLVISRAPALHPGDVQVVNAVTVPEDSPLRRLYNCICFSQKGARDLPSQLSGGDLDGDLYYIMWEDDGKINRNKLAIPADYPRATPMDIGRTVETNDMTDFFLDYMRSDQLGRIANLHQVLADQRDEGTFDLDCLTLAELHSTAVDFAKTGIAVSIRVPLRAW